MAMLQPPAGGAGPTLDVQVLEGLETYIATEQFLHQLEAASAEWIDLSEHKSAAGSHDNGGVELTQVDGSKTQQACQTESPSSEPGSKSSSKPSSSSSSSSSFLRRFSWSRTPATNSSSSSSSSNDAIQSSSDTADAADGPAAPAAASLFEVLEQQPPLHLAQEPALQEPWLLVSPDDAVDALAHYIALVLSRSPEARHMEPQQLQVALRQTFAAMRRARYRVIWDWGRWAYRAGALGASALQLYEHPWLVRAVAMALWTSGKMALGLLV